MLIDDLFDRMRLIFVTRNAFSHLTKLSLLNTPNDVMRNPFVLLSNSMIVFNSFFLQTAYEDQQAALDD